MSIGRALAAGLLYVATGEQYIEEARRSARSAAAVMPDVAIGLVTDAPLADPAFSDVIVLEQSTADPRGYKLAACRASPFERTVLLDSDTHVAADLATLFELLDRFDFAAWPDCYIPYMRSHASPELPASFPEFNTGVIAFARRPRTDALLQRWSEIYAQHAERGVGHDQPSLRQALWNCPDVRLGSLLAEYNFFPYWPALLVGPVRVVHARPCEPLAALATRLNRTTEPRIYLPDGRILQLEDRTDTAAMLGHLLADLRNAIDAAAHGGLPTALPRLRNRVLRRLGRRKVYGPPANPGIEEWLVEKLSDQRPEPPP